MQKGKSPDTLSNKPTVLGSRGDQSSSSYFNKNGPANIGTNLPTLNNPYQSSVIKNSAVGANRNKSLPPQASSIYKYSGIGGGIGGGISGGIGSGIGNGIGTGIGSGIGGSGIGSDPYTGGNNAIPPYE